METKIKTFNQTASSIFNRFWSINNSKSEPGNKRQNLNFILVICSVKFSRIFRNFFFSWLLLFDLFYFIFFYCIFVQHALEFVHLSMVQSMKKKRNMKERKKMSRCVLVLGSLSFLFAVPVADDFNSSLVAVITSRLEYFLSFFNLSLTYSKCVDIIWLESTRGDFYLLGFFH